jgi:chromosome segregation ATPase
MATPADKLKAFLGLNTEVKEQADQVAATLEAAQLESKEVDAAKSDAAAEAEEKEDEKKEVAAEKKEQDAVVAEPKFDVSAITEFIEATKKEKEELAVTTKEQNETIEVLAKALLAIKEQSDKTEATIKEYATQNAALTTRIAVLEGELPKGQARVIASQASNNVVSKEIIEKLLPTVKEQVTALPTDPIQGFIKTMNAKSGIGAQQNQALPS